MKLLVCGGRTYGSMKGIPKDKNGNPRRNHYLYSKRLNQYKHVLATLDKFVEERGVALDELKIITGGARGADLCAVWWARDNGVECAIYHADWDKYGVKAGPIRNRLMYDTELPDVVMAFPGHLGTKHMTEYAESKGCEVIRIAPN